MDLAAAMARLRSGPMRAEPMRDGGIIPGAPERTQGFSAVDYRAPMPEIQPRSTPIRLVILDMDGVLYRGDRAVDGAVELVQHLHDAGLLVRYATNNSMFTRAEYAKRLAGMGIKAEPAEIVTSTSATIEYLGRHEPEIRSVLAVGGQGMVKELRDAGYAVHWVADAAPAAPVDAVIVGLDPDFDDARRALATDAIRHGARFIATNADVRYPTPDGFRPGAGSMVAAIGKSAGTNPLVIGKPELAMFAGILSGSGVASREAVVIGDNPESDIAGAHRSGMTGILVLTGVTDADRAANLRGQQRPDFVVADPAGAWQLIAGWLGS
jgi:HAD superfamily hydrolase (TIGR01450 family)